MKETKRSGFIIWATRLIFGIVLTANSIAADYTLPGLGTRIEDSADLQVENVRILSESTLSNGRILLEVTADVRNSDVGIWENVSAHLNSSVSTNLYDTLPLSIEHTNLVAVGALATASGLINVIVDAANLDVARLEALEGRIMFATAETITGAHVNQATNLPIENIQIVNEENLSSNRVLLQIAAAVRNATLEVLSEASIHLLTTGGTIPYTAPTGILQFGDLAANATGTAENRMYVEVGAADAATVRSNVLTAAAYDTDGLDLWVFNAFPRPIDQPTEDVYEAPSGDGAERTLVFTNVTEFLESLEVGELLVEDRNFNSISTYSPTAPVQYTPLEDMLPFLISSVSISTNRVEVVGRKQVLADILKSATFVVTARDAYRSSRDPYNPPLENTYTEEEKAERAEAAALIEAEDPHDSRLADLKGLVALPWHFNATNIIDRVNLSGEMFFRQSGLKFELKVRDFAIQRAVTSIEGGIVLNLLIEVEGRKEDDEPKEGSRNLLPINPFPPLSFNLGGVPVTIQPELTLTAGVTENVPTSLTLPLQSSFTVGMEAGFDRSRVNATNDGFFYQPILEAVPIRVSDPTVFDELAMTLGAWAELGFGLKIGLGQGGSAQLRAGPSLAVRLNNEFTLAPLNNPWWEVDSGVDLIGRFEMDANFLGFGDVQLADAEASLHHFNIFHRDAGGPLIRGLRAAAANSPPVIEPLIGQNVRWSRMFQPSPGWGFAQGFAFAVPGSSNDVIVGGPGGVSVANAIISKFNARGELVWMKDTFPLGGALMREGAPLPDGSFFTAGTRGFELVVSHFDRDGNRNWAQAYLPSPTILVRDVAAKLGTNGQPELFVTGMLTHGIVTQSDPVLLKFDATGAFVWGFYYGAPGDDEANGMTITADGNVVICGYTAADVAPNPLGTPDPGNALKNAVASGFLMKLDANTGNILWARACASRWGMSFEEIVEAPDGTIYAGGGASKIVTQTRPCNIFAKFSADGSLLNHVLVGDDPDWVDELPNGGSSPYDTVTSLIWTPEGLVACGNTGLGQGTAGWVMALTDELGVKFYSVFDGDYAEDLITVADAGDGLAVVGNSRSLFPLGENTPTAFMLKLPWEGMLRFHENTGMRSLFLQPRVYDSGSTSEFQVFSSFGGFGVGTGFSSATFTNAPVTVTPGGAVADLNITTNHIVRALEKLDSSSVDDFESWAAYHRLPSDDPEADSDGDGSPNYLESYFGQNPWNPDDGAAFAITSSSTNNPQTVVIEFERQSFASGFPVRFESSTNLVTWTAATGVTESVLSINNRTDLVRLSIPANERMLFFRAMAQPAVAP